jgi:hypothetical protein
MESKTNSKLHQQLLKHLFKMARLKHQRVNSLLTYLHERLSSSSTRTKNSRPSSSASKILTCNAIYLYTNIDSKHKPDTIANWLMEYNEEVPHDFPTELS